MQSKEPISHAEEEDNEIAVNKRRLEEGGGVAS